MAYVAHSVYAEGIDKKILGDDKIYIALINNIADNTNNGVLKNVLAVSELRQGSGSSVGSTEDLSVLPGTYNKVGTFATKTLNLLSVSYNRTKSVKGDNSNFNYCGVNEPDSSASTTALGFAIIRYTGTPQELIAYQVEDGGDTKKVVFAGPSITNTNLNEHEVLIVGNLTSNPTINEDSNFMFGGAKITFTEA